MTEQANQGAEATGQAASSIGDELRSLGKEAALEALKVLAPAAKEAAGKVAQEVVERAPGMAMDYGGRLVKRMGKSAGQGVAGAASAGASGAGEVGKSAAGAAGGLVSKLTPGGGKEGGGKEGGAGKDKLDDVSGTGRGRRLPIQESVDVGVPVEAAYAQWTQFEDFAKYMYRTEGAEQKDDTHVTWRTKIWGVRRSFEAEITEQRPKERIVWKATSGAKHVGVITFHPLAHNLTRVQVNLDFQPTGLLEKTGSGLRATRRAVRSDLMRYKALIEMREQPSGEWPGTIKDSEVIEGEDGASEGEGEGQDRPEGERDGQAEGQAQDQDESQDEGQAQSQDEGQDEGQAQSQDEGQDEGQAQGQDEAQGKGQDEAQGERKPEGQSAGPAEEQAEGQQPANGEATGGEAPSGGDAGDSDAGRAESNGSDGSGGDGESNGSRQETASEPFQARRSS